MPASAIAAAMKSSTLFRRSLAAGVALIVSGSAALSQTVVDGDTLRLEGKSHRLWGIDAPESAQACADGWPAGQHARNRLQELVRNKYVVCERAGLDQYNRILAVCRVGGVDLGAQLVREGLAWAFVRYSSDYVGDEEQAKAERLGVHGRECLPTWEWRAQQRFAPR